MRGARKKVATDRWPLRLARYRPHCAGRGEQVQSEQGRVLSAGRPGMRADDAARGIASSSRIDAVSIAVER
ncbi:hypothetical protein XFF6166_230132 [Xanthomonas citri pv. fuscans]|nr:hypothetical protein XFF6166_230132 [Xanthomonas citri pv. fuscans]SOO08929.1 hypothetical protein XFF6970_300022 [Xanthomonas citri pv. fuscans]